MLLTLKAKDPRRQPRELTRAKQFHPSRGSLAALLSFSQSLCRGLERNGEGKRREKTQGSEEGGKSIYDPDASLKTVTPLRSCVGKESGSHRSSKHATVSKEIHLPTQEFLAPGLGPTTGPQPTRRVKNLGEGGGQSSCL